MELEKLELTKNRIGALNKKGICTVEDVQNFVPRKYYDFTSPCGLLPIYNRQHIAVVGELRGIEKTNSGGIFMLKAKLYDDVTGKKLNIVWMGGSYLYRIITEWEYGKVIACGEMRYNEEFHSFHMANPVVFSDRIEQNLRVYPVYRKMSGISEEFMEDTIKKALKAEEQKEIIPENILKKYHLMGRMEALRELHHPKSMDTLNQAQKRMTYEELFTFAMEIEKAERSASKGSQYNIKSLKNTTAYIESLPYSLTNGQRNAFESMRDKAFDGRRIHALVQGDVGSGKTCLAFLMMFAMADSGYQSILMAPTQLLARQHYESLKEAAEPLGFQTAFLSSELKVKERKELLEKIKDGTIRFVVGTHSLLSPDIEYKNLSLAVIDEEHRFGVNQRDTLLNRAKEGMHTISMSATPIPRTMAGVLYGNSIDVFDLEQPAERKPIQTARFANEEKIFEFIRNKYAESKQQTYVVCPWIEEGESEREGIATVENTLATYKKAFSGTGMEVAAVTGKMKAEEVAATIDKFKNNDVQILVATTVIEVGVNVPNANIIVINNAELFGLSQLHQLRGRVGRGKDAGYCILNSKDYENERLKVMCETTNGYEIAQKDMLLRGTGDLLGTEQSGKSNVIEMILKYPNMYEKVKADVAELAKMAV